MVFEKFLNNEQIVVEHQNFEFVIENNDKMKYIPKQYKGIMEILDGLNIDVEKGPREGLLDLLMLCSNEIIQKIKKIYQQPEDKILILRVEGDSTLLKEKTLRASIRSGWYYYITGVCYFEDPQLDNISSELDAIHKDEHGQINSPPSLFKTYIKKSINNSSDEGFTSDSVPLIVPNDVSIKSLLEYKGRWGSMHSFEVMIRKKSVLLDCGFSFLDYMNYRGKEVIRDHLENQVTCPKWVIITHNHKDHAFGIIWLTKNTQIYNNIDAFICSKVTAMNILTEILKDDQNLKYKFKKKLFIVEHDSSIQIARNMKIQFYSSGHIPGCLSVLFKIYGLSKLRQGDSMSHTDDSWTFLYSSDYCMDEISPIISFQETIERLPPHIDFGLVDGARAKKKIPSLEKQINDLYKEAEKTWEKGGSVLIATEENTYAPLLYIKFHEENKKRAFPRPIYVDEDIIRSLYKMTCCSQDLNDDIKGRIRAHKNPFESWQLQLINKNDFQAIYKALASPSLIMTHPNDIEKEPLSEIFPLMAMSSKNMMAFALYLNRNDKVTWDFVKNDPTTIKHETTLNGILPEKKKLRFEPKCHIFNRGEHNKDYKYYTFQNHASRKQLNELRSNVSFDELSLFHEGSKPVLEKIYPKNE